MSRGLILSAASLFAIAALYAPSSHAVFTGASENCLRTAYLGGTCVYCAPEVEKGGLDATERVLVELASGELKDAKGFMAKLEEIKKLDAKARGAAYLALAGIATDEDLAEFVTLKNNPIPTKYVSALTSQTELTTAQAELVLRKVSSALLGQRKN